MRKKFLTMAMAVIMTAGIFTGCAGSASTSEETSSKEAVESSVETSDSDDVSETLSKLRKNGKIVFGGTGSAPFGFVDEESGEYKGINWEISTAVANKLGIEDVEFQIISFDSLIQSLNTGKVDMVSAAMYITDERKEAVDFSNAYYKESEGILFDASKDYKSLEDMKGSVCAVQSGSSLASVAEQYLEEGIFSRLDTYQSLDEMILAVNTGKADVCLGDNVALAYAMETAADTGAELVFLDNYEPIKEGIIGDVFAKGDDAFVAEWNAALDEMKEDGSLLAILEKYGLDESFMLTGDDAKVENI